MQWNVEDVDSMHAIAKLMNSFAPEDFKLKQAAVYHLNGQRYHLKCLWQSVYIDLAICLAFRSHCRHKIEIVCQKRRIMRVTFRPSVFNQWQCKPFVIWFRFSTRYTSFPVYRHFCHGLIPI